MLALLLLGRLIADHLMAAVEVIESEVITSQQRINYQEMHMTEESVMPAVCVTEMKASTHNLLTSNSSTVNLEQFITCENHSSLSRLLQVTAYVFWFIKLLKHKARSTGTIWSIILEPEAERLWIVQAQTLLAQETCFNEWKKQFGP